MRYKPGDKVLIKSLEYLKNNHMCEGNYIWKHRVSHGLQMNEDMIMLCGKIVTIESININTMYSIAENIYSWQDWMFAGRAGNKFKKLKEVL